MLAINTNQCSSYGCNPWTRKQVTGNHWNASDIGVASPIMIRTHTCTVNEYHRVHATTSWYYGNYSQPMNCWMLPREPRETCMHAYEAHQRHETPKPKLWYWILYPTNIVSYDITTLKLAYLVNNLQHLTENLEISTWVKKTRPFVLWRPALPR